MQLFVRQIKRGIDRAGGGDKNNKNDDDWLQRPIAVATERAMMGYRAGE